MEKFIKLVTKSSLIVTGASTFLLPQIQFMGHNLPIVQAFGVLNILLAVGLELNLYAKLTIKKETPVKVAKKKA